MLGNRGTGKTHVALRLGLAPCRKGLELGFATAAALVHDLTSVLDERHLMQVEKHLPARSC